MVVGSSAGIKQFCGPSSQPFVRRSLSFSTQAKQYFVMAPKKNSPASKAEKRTASSKADDETQQEASKKVKEDPESAQKDDRKQQGEDQKEGKPAGKSDTEGLLRWLLTDDAFALAYPPIEPGKGEVDLPAGEQSKPAPKRPNGSAGDEDGPRGKTSHQAGEKGKRQDGKVDPQYPASLDLTPFQTLLCSALLSKPISHRLGLRAITTLFSPPYSYTTPSKLEEAGFEGRRAALWDARTQHKEKTATQLGDIVSGVRDMCKDDEQDDDVQALGAVVRAAEEAAKGKEAASVEARTAAKEAVFKTLSEGIKGVGSGACDIFLRRIQHQWPSVFPYIDARTLGYAVDLGLLEGDGEGESDEELFKQADALSSHLRKASKGDAKPEQHRKDFVRLLDVLVGLGLEKRIDDAKGNST